MKTTIKRCPFCGALPKIDTSDRKVVKRYDGNYGEVHQRVVIECEECFLRKDIETVRFVPWFDEGAIKDVAREATRTTIENFWNARVEHTRLKNGRWLELDDCMTVCSECNSLGCGSQYCPWCGAYMVNAGEFNGK